MDTAFLSLGTRSCSCIARAQEADAAVARPEPAVVRLSHAPLAGVARAASIVSLDSAARVYKRFVTLTVLLVVELPVANSAIERNQYVD